VTNEHGDIRVIVDGIEYTISERMQRTIGVGQTAERGNCR
jgi:hypothetical protein